MLLEQKDFDGVKLRGVMHVGMHEAEEYNFYKNLGITTMCFIEANINLCNKVANTIIGEDENVKIINSAISNESGVDVELMITNNFQSSSILKLKDHSKIYPHIVEVDKIKLKTNTLDQVLKLYDDPSVIDFLVLDIQGVELQAMQGLTNWDSIEAVYTEVNYREMYEGCALEPDVTNFLKLKGFEKIKEIDTGCGWGDALYLRKK